MDVLCLINFIVNDNFIYHYVNLKISTIKTFKISIVKVYHNKEKFPSVIKHIIRLLSSLKICITMLHCGSQLCILETNLEL